MSGVPVLAQTTILLIGSNIFMTLAWYAYLRDLDDRPGWIAAFVSWGVALFQYLVLVCLVGAVYFIFRGHA